MIAMLILLILCPRTNDLHAFHFTKIAGSLAGCGDKKDPPLTDTCQIWQINPPSVNL